MTGSPQPTPEPIDAYTVADLTPVPAAPDQVTPDPATPDPATPDPATPDYDEHGIPSFDHVRSRIEARYHTSLGSTELAEDTPQAQSLQQQQAQRDEAARARLEQIRRSIGH